MEYRETGLHVATYSTSAKQRECRTLMNTSFTHTYASGFTVYRCYWFLRDVTEQILIYVLDWLWNLLLFCLSCTPYTVCVCVCTIFGSDIADNVDFVHGNLPVGFLFAETQSPAFLSVAGVTLNTQKHRTLETRHTRLQQHKHSKAARLLLNLQYCIVAPLHRTAAVYNIKPRLSYTVSQTSAAKSTSQWSIDMFRIFKNTGKTQLLPAPVQSSSALNKVMFKCFVTRNHCWF